MKHSNKLNLIFNPNALLWVLPLLLIVPNFALNVTEQTSMVSKLANFILPLGVYYILASLSHKIGKTALLFIPIMVFCAFQIVLLYLYGESIIAIDMFINVATTNTKEAGELLGNLTIAICTVLVLYLPPIIFGIKYTVKKCMATRHNVMRARVTGLIISTIGLIFLICSYIFSPNYMVSRELFPINVISNLIDAVNRTNASQNYPETSADFSYHASSDRDKNEKEVYVLIVGETTRADRWQLLGYNRDTNPKLSKRSNLMVFPKTLSESNTTHKSVLMIMSHLDAKTFGDSLYHTKSIFEAFNSLGYSTYFFSNQSRNHSYIDYFGEEAQESKFIHDDDAIHYDMELIPHLQEAVKHMKTPKAFIVLHTYGSHFNYRERYTDEFSHFKPDDATNASRENKAQLDNAYDNTIRYTDCFIDSVISSLASLKCKAALVYLGDHGEDIFDDSRNRFLHASPTPTYYQIHIPLAVWMSSEYVSQYQDKYDTAKRNLNKNVSSSASVFNTIMDIAGINTPYYQADYSLTSPKYTEHNRLYLNDYNEAVPLLQSGLRMQDKKIIKSKHLLID